MGKRNFAKEVAAIVPSMHIALARQQPKDLMKGKITFSQTVIVQLLSRKKYCKMTDIAKMLDVTKSAVTGFSDRLIKMQIIKRFRSRKDRRIVNVTLTPKGKALAKKLDNFRLKVIAKLFSSLNRKERAQYLHILQKITKNIKE